MVKIEETTAADDAYERAAKCKIDGNELLAKGDYADAAKLYDEGLLALVRVGGDGRASEARVALHLNASLAHLRRGNLASAVEHAGGALAADPQNVKALYRRGLARTRLAEHPGHEGETAKARADFELALELEPNNVEVRTHLKNLRSAMKADQKELVKCQRENFKGIFASDKPLYEDAPVAEISPILYSSHDERHQLLLSAEGLSFQYVRNEPVLKAVDLELRRNWCVGLFGNNAAGKTTILRLLNGKLAPKKGRIIHHNRKLSNPSTSIWTNAASSVLATSIVGAISVLFALALGGKQKLSTSIVWWHWIIIALCTLVVMIVFKVMFGWRKAKESNHSIVFVTSDSQEKEDIPRNKTIEKVIGDALPKNLKSADRRARVISWLQAANFQMYNQETGEAVGTPKEYVNDGLEYGCLSGGQRHLIYVLRCLAKNPDILLCDELLGGLDAWRQPRVLHMLKRLKTEVGMSIFYISTELHQLRLIADSIGFLENGQICELGATEDLLDFPKHPATKDYITQYRSLPGGRVIGGKLAEFYTGLEGDRDIAGPWLQA